MKQEREQESSVTSIMKDIVDFKNDAVKEEIKIGHGGKFAKLVNDAQRHLLGK